ncbi:MAG: XRE family transcriptional regulator [Candidatus Brocadiales bacterium]|nr:XRE family transcriptional regulator [Candidatus Brocadiales bacterium]
MLAINISTPTSVLDQLKSNYKQKRLQYSLTQVGLSSRSGVSLGSIKRFESTGQISLESLLKISLVLECLDDFSQIAIPKEPKVDSLEQLLKIKPKSIQKRGTIK